MSGRIQGNWKVLRDSCLPLYQCGVIKICPGTADTGLESWRSKDILTIGHLYETDITSSDSLTYHKLNFLGVYIWTFFK